MSWSSMPPVISSGQAEIGSLALRWEPLRLTEERARLLWEQMQQFPVVFDDFSRGNYENFVSKFFIPSNVFIDIGPGLGLAAGFATKPGLDTVLHLVMFDRRLRGREPVFMDIMHYFFAHLKLRRMTAMIAEDARTAINLVRRLGFTQEGCMRNAIQRNGKLLDTYIFGILKEELDGQMSEARAAGPVTHTGAEPTAG